MASKFEEDSAPLWLWPNLLSLDAPLVAVLWQGFLAYRFSLPLRPAGRLVLGLTVWAIYFLDRLSTRENPCCRNPPVIATIAGIGGSWRAIGRGVAPTPDRAAMATPRDSARRSDPAGGRSDLSWHSTSPAGPSKFRRRSRLQFCSPRELFSPLGLRSSPRPGWAAAAFFVLCLANIRDRSVGMARARIRASSTDTLVGSHLPMLGSSSSGGVRFGGS